MFKASKSQESVVRAQHLVGEGTALRLPHKTQRTFFRLHKASQIEVFRET